MDTLYDVELTNLDTGETVALCIPGNFYEDVRVAALHFAFYSLQWPRTRCSVPAPVRAPIPLEGAA